GGPPAGGGPPSGLGRLTRGVGEEGREGAPAPRPEAQCRRPAEPLPSWPCPTGARGRPALGTKDRASPPWPSGRLAVDPASSAFLARERWLMTQLARFVLGAAMLATASALRPAFVVNSTTAPAPSKP